MKTRLLVTVCLALLAVFPAASEDLVPLRRFALVPARTTEGRTGCA